MKKLLHIFCILLLVGCMHKGEKEEANNDSIYIAPDSVWDYSYIDSIDHAIKCKSYKLYGDSNALENGLPDSIMARKDSFEHLRN